MMNDDLGKLVLRLTLGILILLHGLAKITSGVDWLFKTLEGAGLPAFVAYGVYVGEVIAPLLVIIGFYSRIAALVIAGNMLFAIGLVHMKDLFVLTKTGGWAIELQAFFLFTAVALALTGPGRFSVNRK